MSILQKFVFPTISDSLFLYLQHLRCKGDDVVYCAAAGEEHGEPVHAQGYARCLGHVGEGGKKAFRLRIGGFTHISAMFLLPVESRPLLIHIGKFRKGIGQFEASHINLESFGNSGISLFETCQRRQRCGIIIEKGGPVLTETGFYVRRHDFIEAVLFQEGIPGTGYLIENLQEMFQGI